MRVAEEGSIRAGFVFCSGRNVVSRYDLVVVLFVDDVVAVVGGVIVEEGKLKLVAPVHLIRSLTTTFTFSN